MKVLIVSAADKGGGAFIAAYRLHQAFVREGFDVKMLVIKKTFDTPSIIGRQTNVSHTFADIKNYCTLPLHWLNQTTNDALHSFNIFPSGLHDVINAMDVDIVNLHWINREMISVAEIGKIRQPIVWTLHDMWPILGSAHYKNIQVNSAIARKEGLKLDNWMYRRKARHWLKKNITFVSPSTWLAEEVKKSRLFHSSRVEVISNTIDLDIFKPINTHLARQLLGLDINKKYVLFGAMSYTSDPRKGFRYLCGAMKMLPDDVKRNTELLIFGGGKEPLPDIEQLGLKAHYLGRFYDELSLSIIYNAADVFVAPSLMDNLPNTVVESLSCGTPVAAFAIGGMVDLIQHKINGYLAVPLDESDLANGICWQLEKNEKTDNMESTVRAIALENFSPANITAQYNALFKSLL